LTRRSRSDAGPQNALTRAWEACRAYRYAEAEALFKGAIRSNPQSIEAHLGLGDLYGYQERTVAALRCYGRARRLFPRDPRPAVKLGELRFKRGELSRASAALSAALATGPSLRAHLLLGHVLQAQGKSRLADAQYRAAAAGSFPADNYHLAQLDKVEANLLARRFPQAFGLADGLYAADPTQNCIDGLKRSLVCWSQRSDGRGVQAGRVAALEAFARKHPRDPWPWAALLYAAMRAGRPRKETRRLASRLVKTATGPHGWLLSLCSDFLRCLAPDGGLVASGFERESQAAPALWKMRASQAEQLFRRGDAPSALRAFSKMIQELTGQAKADAIAWRGELHLWRGNYAKALADFDAGLALGARYARGWRGAALVCQGRLKEALRDLDQSLAASPNDPETLTWRGEALRILGRLPQALRSLTAAAAIDDSYWARINIALIRHREGAEPEFRNEISRLPEEIRARLSRHKNTARGLQKILDAGRGLRRK